MPGHDGRAHLDRSLFAIVVEPMRSVEKVKNQKPKRMRGRQDKTPETSAIQLDGTVAKSKDALRLLLETANDYSVVILGPQGEITSWNTNAERLYGYRSDEIIGKNLSSLYSTDDVERGGPDDALKLATAEGRNQQQTWHLRKDGSRFFADVTIAPLKDESGRLFGFCKITRDLTEIKFAEMARALFECFPSAIVVIDHDGRIVEMNTQLESMFGYRRKELQDQPIDLLIPERFREQFIEQITGYVPDPHIRKMGNGLELSARRKDGTEFPMEVLLNPINSGQGILMVVIRDITEPRRTAEDVRKTNDELMTLVTELQRRDREMQSLISMDDLLQSCTSQEDTYKVIDFAAAELFERHAGCLAVLQASGQYLEVVARWGAAPLTDPIFSLDDCWALRRGQLHEIANAETGLLCRHFVGHPNTRYLCIPLTVQGEILGVFCLAGAPADTSEHQIGQLQLAVTVSESIKLSLSNLKLREKLRAEAIHDPLTGLFNRRYLEETLIRELHRARRRSSPLCLAMLDLDNFKRFNDTHGHEAGDTLLRELGRLMREKLRKSDISCRYGGEEFVIVLPDSSLLDAEQRIEQIRTQLKEAQIQHGGEFLPAPTVSAGVTQADEHNFDPGGLLRAADKALYTAKNAGRDRVIRYSAKASSD
jgi:diguanylate cyclase (GGDEF)-like protein/PAS domain S-box-containing protein